ncbi:SAM hydroxide adenosyltransferase [Actinokineospora soli]|uniref:SAM hydroxide adenosyltransferase n=1 Tax=Actinokineospora soli TaxID=1048753 RepID=A0ABW2U043_9PSEU
MQLAAGARDLAITGATPGSGVHVEIGGRSVEARVGRTFADVPAGSAVVLLDSAGRVAVAVNGGSAQAVFHGTAGQAAVLLVERQ